MRRRRDGLVGRAEEHAALVAVLDAVRAGSSGVAVLEGQAGIGKTALLDEAVGAAGDLVVVRVVAIESEMALGYAALHHVLTRFAHGVGDLPGPQAQALEAVFGNVDGGLPDVFLVGLATLNLLSSAAADRGILLVVDDAQWLDDESARILGFVARRLYADRVGMLITRRDTIGVENLFDGLPVVTVGRLPDERAQELLDLDIDGPIAEQVRQRVIEDARGNPLALLEIARELSVDQLAGIEPLPTPYPINQDLQARFLRRIRTLPHDTQTYLLVAAADPTGDPGLVRDAARLLGCDATASEPAETEALLQARERVEFRHPLVRSAVYVGATENERRRAHGALAAATDRRVQPDRYAWHRAVATAAPDEEVATELEQAAAVAQTSGSYAASATLAGRAAELTPDPARRATRYLGASVAALTAGKAKLARSYLHLAQSRLDDPMLEAQARRLEVGVEFVIAASDSPVDGNGGCRALAAVMLDAAHSLEEFDLRLARETVLEALPMAVYAGALSSVSAAEVARAAQSMRLTADADTTALDALLDSLADLFADGYAVAVPRLRRALAEMRADPDVRERPRYLTLACWAAFALSDDDSVRLVAQECVARGRDRFAWQVVAEALPYLGQCELRAGSIVAADRCFEELMELESLLGTTAGPGEANQLVVAACKGQEGEVRERAAALAHVARERGIGHLTGICDQAIAVLELGLGNYEAAALCAPAAVALDIDPAVGPLRASDGVEAHVRGGTRTAAEPLLDWLTTRAAATRHPFDLGLQARARALTSDDSETEAHYAEAISQLQKTTSVLHLARTQLLYGEWLRRRKRRRDARIELSAAHETFESMGARAFEQRARIELLATGARARKRNDTTRRDLTPQEEHIARLAARGATNPEIGARLFISSATVDYHLRKVYAKLEIPSRRELVNTQYFDDEPTS